MSRRRVSRSTWDIYVRRFHTERPGIAEAVLARCRHNDQTPYQWLTDALSSEPTVIDLACGSAPTRRHLGPGWVGIDTSTDELAAAGPETAGRVAAEDVTRLPFRDRGFDQAVCSMALMVVDPLPKALAEIHRVLRPGAEVRILLPTSGPLTVADRCRYVRLAVALGTTHLFPPTPLTNSTEMPLHRAGLTLLSDERGRFAYRIESSDDAGLLIDSLYSPPTVGTTNRRSPQGRIAMARRRTRHPTATHHRHCRAVLASARGCRYAPVPLPRLEDRSQLVEILAVARVASLHP